MGHDVTCEEPDNALDLEAHGWLQGWIMEHMRLDRIPEKMDKQVGFLKKLKNFEEHIS